MGGFVEIDYPYMSPGTCFICTSGHKEGMRWFDSLKDVWKVGRLYFCSDCITNLANDLGINPNQALQARVEELEAENERGNAALAVLAGIRASADGLDIDSPLGEEKPPEGIKGTEKLAVK